MKYCTDLSTRSSSWLFTPPEAWEIGWLHWMRTLDLDLEKSVVFKIGAVINVWMYSVLETFIFSDFLNTLWWDKQLWHNCFYKFSIVFSYFHKLFYIFNCIGKLYVNYCFNFFHVLIPLMEIIKHRELVKFSKLTFIYLVFPIRFSHRTNTFLKCI